ncbi:MAG: hypothetical protein J6U54_01690 [Clostridiales bacterium]|nr:hypothetical protein [Clostridiales bacterium]
MNTMLKLKLAKLLEEWLLSDYIDVIKTDLQSDGAYVTVFVKKELMTDKEKLKKRILKKVLA